MERRNWSVLLILASTLALFGSAELAWSAEDADDYVERATSSPAAYWSSRVLGDRQTIQTTGGSPAVVSSRQPVGRQGQSYIASRPARTRVVSSYTELTPEPEVIPPGEMVMQVEPPDGEGEVIYSEFPGEEFAPVPGDENVVCEAPYCGGCFLFGPWLEHLSVFAGAHGFKGPTDLGRNGNFGLHEGLNYAAPLGGPWNIGYQVGLQVAHSDFAGHQTLTWFGDDQITEGNRTQMFFSSGLFRRPECDRWQWSVLFDWMHDDYYVDSDLLQIRHELSFYFDDQREFGYFGAYGVKDDELPLPPNAQQQERYLDLSVLDRYALFYRRHFCNGGEGRFWVGVSGYGDGLLGGDILLPLDTNWAFEANFAYLAPSTGQGADGQMDEQWSLVVGLVWYPGRPADYAIGDMFRAVQGVADNTSMMFHGRMKTRP